MRCLLALALASSATMSPGFAFSPRFFASTSVPLYSSSPSSLLPSSPSSPLSEFVPQSPLNFNPGKNLKRPYISPSLNAISDNKDQIKHLFNEILSASDPLWYQIKLEARSAVALEPKAGPLIYSSVLFHDNLMAAVTEIVSQICGTQLIPATEFANLVSQTLTYEDHLSIVYDIMAPFRRPFRSPTHRTALQAILYNHGFHALVVYRVAHRLWLSGRKSLAHYLQR